MTFMRPRILLALPIALAALVPGFRTTPAAHADYGRAIYQIAISQNCNNPTLCAAQGGTGGFWGWIAVNNDGTIDAELTGCGHTVGGGGPGTAGAGHTSIDGTWTYGPGPLGPGTELYATSETDVSMGRFPGSVTIPSEYADTGIPLVPGHYSTTQILGFSAPGIHFMIQVTYIPPK